MNTNDISGRCLSRAQSCDMDCQTDTADVLREASASILSLIAIVDAAREVVRCKAHPATGSRLVLEADLLRLEAAIAAAEAEA